MITLFTLGPQGRLGPQALKVQPDLKATKVQPVLSAPQVYKGSKGPLAQPDLKENKVSRLAFADNSKKTPTSSFTATNFS